MANSVVSVAANGQQQTVLAPSGSLSGSAVTPLTALFGPDGATLISTTNPLPVSIEGQAINGAWQFTATTTPTALGSLAVSYVWLKADPSNTHSVYIGNNTSQYYTLQANESWEGAFANVSQLFVKTASSTALLNVITRGL